MATHLTTPPPAEFVDPRRTATGSPADANVHTAYGPVIFTANAAGTTTTIVGANATPSANTNVIRVGEKVVLKNAAGARKEEKVFTVTAVAVGASTTVTFSPAAAVATVSTDTLQLVAGLDYPEDNESLDRRLNTINGTTFTQARLDTMTQNDKIYALRVQDDPTSF
jgi:hypothetical protein